MNKSIILFISVLLLSCFFYTVESLTLAQLTAQFNGKIIPQAHADFNNARAGYNARLNRIPQIIVQPLDTASVVLALEYAQTNNFLVSIKSGGHSPIAEGVQDLRVVIDLSQMKKISYDNVSNTIITESGNKWVELYNYTINQHLVATPGGQCPSVGIGGLTLGGGSNELSSTWGTAADNVVEMEVVLANRTVVIANNNTNQDLFWALRGAGHGGFGIVTKFTFKAYPVLPKYSTAWITYNWKDFEDVLTFVNKQSEIIPHQVNLYFTAWKNSNISEPLVGLSCFYHGDPALHETHCGVFRSFAGIKKNTVISATSFSVTTQSYYDTVRTSTDPKQRMSFTKGSIVTEVSKKVIRRIIDAMEDAPVTPYSFNNARINFYYQGGIMNEMASDFNAFPHRTYTWSVVWLASFTGNDYIEPYQKWITKSYKKIKDQFSEGVYQNYPDDDLEDWSNDYYLGNYPRLRVIKRAYDPTNYFRHLQSIKP